MLYCTLVYSTCTLDAHLQCLKSVQCTVNKHSPGLSLKFWFGGGEHQTKFHTRIQLKSCTVQSYNEHQWRRQNFGWGTFSKNLLNKDFWKIYIKFAQKFKKILQNFSGIKFKKISNFLWKCSTFWINKKCNCALKKLLKFIISLIIRKLKNIQKNIKKISRKFN